MSPRPTAPRTPIATTPVEQRGLEAAVRLFTGRFVVPDKQAQLAQRLATAARRAETLAALPRWLVGAPSPLAGAEQSPAGLEARVGAQVGVHLDADGARRTTIGDALALGRGHAALFVADTGRLALVFRADCAPLLSIRL
ncbi:MAG: hypothetical protein IPH44_22155 [Myxococcales bacterium]|nr:hypothetical protein [Myxococcales bacterium]MBK7192066.1 hypothetical protein [Myxococcales bacterium]